MAALLACDSGRGLVFSARLRVVEAVRDDFPKQVLQRFEHGGHVLSLALSPVDKGTLVTGCDDGPSWLVLPPHCSPAFWCEDEHVGAAVWGRLRTTEGRHTKCKACAPAPFHQAASGAGTS